MSTVEQVISQFEGKLRSLMSENEALRLQLHKANILAQSRSANNEEQLKVLNACNARVINLEKKNELLQQELDDCYRVIENLTADNRELKLENTALREVEVELKNEQQKARVFKEMYLQVTARSGSVLS